MFHQFDIVAVGECLIDFVSTLRDGKLFLEGNPGGAPANVLAMAAQLGLSTAMVGKVGQDSFGDFLRGHVLAAGIETSMMPQSIEFPTTLAIVQLDEHGNRNFGFYRKQTADVMLREEELPLEEIRSAKIFHFGSVSLTDEPARSATLFAARSAKEAGVCVSYDPNLRPSLWHSLAEARAFILQGLALADLVKVSEDELFFLTGAKTIADGVEQLFQTYAPALLAVTLGPNGCIFRTAAGSFSSRTFDTLCIDTTGAGDAFWGAALSWLLLHDKSATDCTSGEIQTLMDFANAAGSLATTKLGAIPAMPNLAAIQDCIKNMPRVG